MSLYIYMFRCVMFLIHSVEGSLSYDLRDKIQNKCIFAAQMSPLLNNLQRGFVLFVFLTERVCVTYVFKSGDVISTQ